MRILLLLLLAAGSASAGWRHDCRAAARICRQTQGESLTTTTSTTATTTTLYHFANPSQNCPVPIVDCIWLDHREYCEFPAALACQPPACVPSSSR